MHAMIPLTKQHITLGVQFTAPRSPPQRFRGPCSAGPLWAVMKELRQQHGGRALLGQGLGLREGLKEEELGGKMVRALMPDFLGS